MLNMAITVSSLCKTFRKRKSRGPNASSGIEKALDDVSFQIGLGETYGLLGPNGSGKSTLIRILSTLLTPDSGRVSLLGFSIPGEEASVRKVIGRVSVDAAFYKKLSARENLLYSALMYGIDRKHAEQRAMSILERLGMESRRFSDPLEEMSRGMQQKVSLARALLVNPPVLLLDEPTTGLDPRSRRDVHLFLEDLRREHGTTILLTTHDMPEAERMCDRMAFLFRGRLVSEGTADELKQRSGRTSLDDTFIDLTGGSLDEEPVAAGGGTL
ncbi:MAG TPA: ABC transporter ATP-binding protein [Blastocatellia bacterium]|nr:ABC transporter ATP-binding protein [Blastocatellia bacterium]